jgi:hypothetical protein
MTSITMLVVIGGLAGCSSGSSQPDPPERSPQQVLDDFLAARQAGDCEQVLDLVAPDSWSQDGRLHRSGFLDQCEDAIADLETRMTRPPRLIVEDPSPDEAPSEGERALVSPRAVDSDGEEQVLGALVFHDRRWLVELDRHVLRLGRSPEETVQGYLRAYNDGDCDAVLDLLAPALWSRDGALSAEQFLAQCQREADARARSEQLTAEIADLEVTSISADSASVEVGVREDDGGNRLTHEAETMELVPDGLEWTLSGASPGAGRGDVPLLGVRLLEVDALLLDELTVDGQACRAEREVRSSAFDGRVYDGVSRLYICGSDPFTYQIGLYPFADADAARDAVAPIVGERDDPGACPGSCTDLFTVVAHGSFVVEVGLGTGTEADLDAVVAAQIARLA